MKPEFGVTESDFNTSYAPLCVLGQVIWESNQLSALREFSLSGMKTCEHTPGEKLMDALLLILSGYPSLYLLNSKLRPDPMLAQTWHRGQFADQSVVSRTLDAFTLDELQELGRVSHSFWQMHSQLSNHDWRQRLMLDLDLTPLRASRHAEASTKGYFDKKTPRVGNWPA